MPPAKPFEELAKDFGLKEATVEALKTLEVDSTAILIELRESDIEALELSLGRRRLLDAWHKKLTSTKSKGRKSTSSGVDKSEPAGAPALPNTESLAQDPALAAEVQQYMGKGDKLSGLFQEEDAEDQPHKHQATSSDKKTLHIPDFVIDCRGSCEEDEDDKLLIPGAKTSIFMRTNDSDGKTRTKPRPEDVTMGQWTGANARIQQQLTKRERINRPLSPTEVSGILGTNRRLGPESHMEIHHAF